MVMPTHDWWSELCSRAVDVLAKNRVQKPVPVIFSRLFIVLVISGLKTEQDISNFVNLL